MSYPPPHGSQYPTYPNYHNAPAYPQQAYPQPAYGGYQPPPNPPIPVHGGHGGYPSAPSQMAQSSSSPPPNALTSDLLTFTKVPTVDPVTSAMCDAKAREMARQFIGDAPREEGQRSLETEADFMILQARQEHFNADGDFEIGTSPLDNVDAFGYGVVYYFELIKFLGAICFVFSVCQIVQYALWADSTRPIFNNLAVQNVTRQGYLDLMITRFTAKQFRPWIGINIVLLVLTFASGPLFYYYNRWRMSKEAEQKVEVEEQDRVLRLTDQLAIDVSHYYRSKVELIVRRVVSWLVMILLLGVQVVASYFITRNSSQANIGVATAIAVVAAVLNIIFQLISGKLTEMEKWQSYGAWKVSQAAKLLIFRFGNVVTIYASTDYAASRDQNCTYDVIGGQFLMLLVIEIAVNNIVSLVLAFIRRQLAPMVSNKTGSVYGIRDTLPQFDLAYTVLNLAYRQYVLVMAMVVFPLSIAMGFLGYFVQYWVDKILLFRICGQPRRVKFSRAYLSLLMFFVAAIAIATPFAGAGFVLSGFTRDQSDLCRFPPR